MTTQTVESVDNKIISKLKELAIKKVREEKFDAKYITFNFDLYSGNVKNCKIFVNKFFYNTITITFNEKGNNLQKHIDYILASKDFKKGFPELEYLDLETILLLIESKKLGFVSHFSWSIK